MTIPRYYARGFAEPAWVRACRRLKSPAGELWVVGAVLVVGYVCKVLGS